MRCRLLVAAMSVVVGGLMWAGAAQAAVLGDVTMYSDTGDYIGAGAQDLFDASNASFTVSGSAGDLTVAISSNAGDWWNLEFAAPPGQTLQPGVYDNAGRAPFRGAGEPGVDIEGDGRGCNTDSARFEVKDIHTDSSGVPDRLWIVYEQRCEGAEPALFGEVRIGEPASDAALTTLPGLVRWPANNFGTPETVVPAAFVASSRVDLTTASLTGADPSDFAIRDDECGGETLPAGAACSVYVRFTPSGPGLRTATLVVHDTAGNAYTVPLQGWTYGGTTRLVMSSDSGDFVGQGLQYSFDPTDGNIEAVGTRQSFSFSINAGQEWWSGDFAPSQGDIFAPNSTWTGAQRTPFRGASAGVDVNGDSRGCNTVIGQLHVIDATYAPDGTMKTFGVTFDQHCEGAQPALHGEFDWRLGDKTPPAPWMANPPTPSPTATDPSPDPTNNATANPQTTTTAPSVPARPTTTTTAPATAPPKTTPPVTTPSSVAAALGRTLTRLRADSARSAKALTAARRHPANAADRRAAIDALSSLNRDAGTAQKAFSSYRQLRVDLAAWQSVLALEVRSLATTRKARAARTSQLDARARAAQTAALRAIARLQQQLRPL
jgi:hypothetical protein